jgi:hypothetical protein
VKKVEKIEEEDDGDSSSGEYADNTIQKTPLGKRVKKTKIQMNTFYIYN